MKYGITFFISMVTVFMIIMVFSLITKGYKIGYGGVVFSMLGIFMFLGWSLCANLKNELER